MTEKVDVNGDDRHEIFAELVDAPNEKGERRRRELELREVAARRRRRGPGPVPAAGRAGDPRLVAAIEGALGVA